MARQKQSGVITKICMRCNRVLPLIEFYTNKGWKQQMYRDSWCRDCVKEYCTDKEKLEQYCYENNRLWKDSYWETAEKKAALQLSTDPTYCGASTPIEKKREMMTRSTITNFWGIMNLSNIYVYVNNMGNSQSTDSRDQMIEDATKGEKMVYSKIWRGYYTPTQIEWLDDTYSRYEEDFVLDNINIQDYARKIAKASLNADVAEDRMRRGEGSYQEYKEAQKIFDDLSKSSNFAACKRKAGEATGLGSLGEIILRLEVSGKLNTNGFTFPPDDVDKIIHDFEHTLRSIGLEGQV